MSGWLAGLALAMAVVVSARRGPSRRLLAWEPPAPTAFSRSAGTRRATAMLGAAVTLVVMVAASHGRVPVPAMVALLGGGVVATRLRRRWLAAREREARSTATVEVTFALAGELRAGRTPAQALAAVAPMAGPLQPGLAAARAAVEVGGDAAAELAHTAAAPGAERLRFVAAAWSVAESAGGRIAVVLERLSESMDADDELRRELDAAMAGPRATIMMLATLPLLGLALGQSVGAHPFELLLHRPLGWGLLAAAATLDTIGVVITRAIARTALRA